MPSRAYTSFLRGNWVSFDGFAFYSVNALSGLYLISTKISDCKGGLLIWMCQCPLGLIPHFYGAAEAAAEVGRVETCQCPLGLIPHFYQMGYRAVSSCREVSMPSRAYTSFLRYPFKNLGFMRFPEPVFAVICQNILATAVFRAC